MKDEPREDERIVEAIEAYRPGRDDPSDPALAPLVERLAADAELARKHQRLQRLDSVLSEAIRDVPVPEGLCQRILDRLDAAAKVPETPGEVAVNDAPDAGEAVEVLPDRRAIARRRWLLSATAATVAASVAVGAFLALQPRGGYTETDVLDVAVQFFDAPRRDRAEPCACEQGASGHRRVPRGQRGRRAVGAPMATDPRFLRSAGGRLRVDRRGRRPGHALCGPVRRRSARVSAPLRPASPRGPPAAVPRRLGRPVGCSTFWSSKAIRIPIAAS